LGRPVPCTCAQRVGAWIHVPRTCKVQGTDGLAVPREWLAPASLRRQ
jgi:hypothetical protein